MAVGIEIPHGAIVESLSLGPLRNSDPSFDQGIAKYGRYLGTAYAEFVIGDYMTEGFYPVLLHQDPRYFRNGNGTTRSHVLCHRPNLRHA